MNRTDSDRPIAIDLFAGAGGLALGFEQAGFDVPVAVEIDPVHAAVHQFNFPECEVIPRSVKEISGKEIRAVAGLSYTQPIAVVIGGAPCQGFSIMGPRSLSDPRNVLVKDFIRLVADLQPSYFVFENVKGLTIGRNRPFLEEVIAEMSAIGYHLINPWQLLNACNYGVPQNRERLFLIGAKNGLPTPSYPEMQQTRPTCAEALDDLPDAECFEALRQVGEVLVKLPKPESHYGALMRCEPQDSVPQDSVPQDSVPQDSVLRLEGRSGWHFGYRRQWDRSLLTNSIRTNHSVRSRDRFANTEPGKREPVSHFFRLPPNGICNTLRAGTDSARGSFTSPRPIHHRYARCITVREMARLHGFPDWFRLHSTKWHGARQVGNSVPPPLARAIAAQLLKVLGHKPSMPQRILPAGDERLLTMTAEMAANYWGIESPIRQRDRKVSVQETRKVSVQETRPLSA